MDGKRIEISTKARTITLETPDKKTIQIHTQQPKSVVFSNDANNIVAGQNISISGSTVSATGYAHNATNHSFSTGFDSEARGLASFAEGRQTLAQGAASHAEGYKTKAKGMVSHAEGYETIANQYQHVEGKFNIEDANNELAFIIGNGTANDARSNAFAIKWDGTIVSEYLDDLLQGSGSKQNIVKPYCYLTDELEYHGDVSDEQVALIGGNPVDYYDPSGVPTLWAKNGQITEYVIKAGGHDTNLLLVNPSDGDAFVPEPKDWYDNSEYIIRIVCENDDAYLIVPESIRWASPLHREAAGSIGIENDDFFYMPPMLVGHTYDIHILNGIAWWFETLNAE